MVPYQEVLEKSVQNGYQDWHIASLHGSTKGATGDSSDAAVTQNNHPDSAIDLGSDEAMKYQRTAPVTEEKQSETTQDVLPVQ